MTRLIYVSLFALAACQDAPEPNQTTPVEAPVKDIDTLPADESAAAAQGAGKDAPTLAGGVIPTAMQGRWGLVPADCTSTRGDAKGLLTITGDTLTFYESRATVDQVMEARPERLTANLAFTGEGMTWREVQTLALENGALLRTARELQPLRYTRCS